MEQNEENKTTNIQQEFISKYLINSMTTQKNQSINSLSNNHHLNSREYFQHIEKIQEYLLNLNQQNLSIPKSNINQDSMYWERRKKNNEAAKRSRNARRIKEDEIALRATLLEQENVKLRLENTHLKYENLQLRYQIYKTIKS